jgi:hypothetical protein
LAKNFSHLACYSNPLKRSNPESPPQTKKTKSERARLLHVTFSSGAKRACNCMQIKMQKVEKSAFKVDP